MVFEYETLRAVVGADSRNLSDVPGASAIAAPVNNGGLLRAVWAACAVDVHGWAMMYGVGTWDVSLEA